MGFTIKPSSDTALDQIAVSATEPRTASTSIPSEPPCPSATKEPVSTSGVSSALADPTACGVPVTGTASLITPAPVWTRYVAQIRQDVERLGLSTEPLPRLVVLNQPGRHRDMVTTVINGPDGLIPGAQVETVWPPDLEQQLESRMGEARYAEMVHVGTIDMPTSAQIRRSIELSIEASLYTRAIAIDHLMLTHDIDERVIVAMPFGNSPYSMSLDLVGGILSQEFKDAVDAMAFRPPEVPISRALLLTTDAYGKRRDARINDVATFISDRVTQQLADERSGIATATRSLQAAIDDGRTLGGVFMSSAGNYGHGDEDPLQVERSHFTAGIRGMYNVGGYSLGEDLHDPADDVMRRDSSPGSISFAVPATGVPVGPGGRPVNGTSFGVPLGMAVVGLMFVQDPSMSDQKLDAILTDPAHFRDLPGERDGRGALIPIRVILRAKG